MNKFHLNNLILSGWILTILNYWLMIGLFIDGWAHNHIKQNIESFFTPWHAIFYSGFIAVSAFVFTFTIKAYRKNQSFHSLPYGYLYALAGIVIFGLGAVFDFIWHSMFGFELSIEALISPSHLLLATGMWFIFTSPIRSAWHQIKSKTKFSYQLPMILSLALLLSLLTFYTQYIHPFYSQFFSDNYPLDRNFFRIGMGTTGIILQTAFLVGCILYPLLRWSLLPGSLTIMFTLNAIGMTSLLGTYHFIVPAFLAGIVCDVLLYLLVKPGKIGSKGFYIFFFLMPVIYWSLYMATLEVISSIAVTLHVWSGAIVLAGITGLFLATLTRPGINSQKS